MTYDIMQDYRRRFVGDRGYVLGEMPWSDVIGHLTTFYGEVAKRDNPTVIELGVRGGESTCALLAACHATGGTLYSCDIAAPSVPAEWYTMPEWHFMQGDSVSEAVLSWMPSKADVIFIDTSHTYDQTVKELESYVPRLSKGAIMLMHDTEMEAPLADHPTGDVARALDYFSEQTGIKWENRPGCYGLGVITR